jgi:Tol biopolymer transport system component
VITVDGSQLERLAAGGQCGAWSPDGTRIVYVALFQGLYVVNADGTGKRSIAGPGAGCPVVWSPDGSAIAYAAGHPDGTTDVTVVPSGGGVGVVLARSPGSEFPESWK